MSLTDFGFTFHHFGLAVRKIDAARKVLEGMGYSCCDTVYDPLQEVSLVWCDHPNMPAVEIVAPTDKPGPLDAIIASSDASVYHMCYEAVSIEDSVSAIREADIRIIPVVLPKPAVLFDGRHVGFYQLRGFGLIEIVEAS